MRGFAGKVAFGVMVVGVSVAACGPGEESAGAGRVQVFLEGEASIADGVAAGTGDEAMVDGWTVTYQSFLVTVGNHRAWRSSNPSDVRELPQVQVVDMLALPQGGFVVGEWADMAAVQWDRFSYDIPNANAQSVRHELTSQEDYDRMVQNGWSLYFEATLQKDNVTHRVDGWGLAAGTRYADCAPESGDSGFSVTAGGTVQIKPTIHGDHWFFTNITQGAEITERRAQWIVDSDTNGDGVTTLDELRNTNAADVFPSAQYNLAGSGMTILTALDYLEAQARTLGDFQGHGECPTRTSLP